MSERNEPVASDEHDTSPEYTVSYTTFLNVFVLQIFASVFEEAKCMQGSSAYPEATNEVDEACSKVEREYKRFLLECGLNDSYK